MIHERGGYSSACLRSTGGAEMAKQLSREAERGSPSQNAGPATGRGGTGALTATVATLFAVNDTLVGSAVLETKRLLVIALGVNSRPTQRRIHLLGDNGKTKRSEKTMLRGFHVPEKICIMHDADQVRLREFNQTP